MITKCFVKTKTKKNSALVRELTLTILTVSLTELDVRVSKLCDKYHQHFHHAIRPSQVR